VYPRLGRSPPCNTGFNPTEAFKTDGVLQGVPSQPVVSYKGFSAHTPIGEVVEEKLASPEARKVNSP